MISRFSDTVKVSLLLIAGGIILTLGSLTETGNAIGNLMGTGAGLIGIALLIIGLIVMVISSKN